MTARVLRVALLLFGSGACALVYQVVWLRQLRLVFGASTPASAAVLAIFMGGLGVGGIFWGRLTDRHKRPLRLYAHLELAIAGCAAATPFLLLLVRQAYVWLGGSPAMGMVTATLVRLMLSTLVLGVPAFLMGGTLPAAARAITAETDAGRRRLAGLYGVNTLGAVLGVTLATFFMLEIFGARHTLWIACLANVLIGMTARSMSGSATTQRLPPEIHRQTIPREVETAPAAMTPAFVFAAAGVVGFAFMLMELVWYRMLGPLLGGTTYTFGLILAMALLGIGLGGAVYAVRSESSTPSPLAFALTCGLEAFFLALPFALGDRLAVLAALLRPLGQVGLAGHVVSWSLLTGLVVLPAAAVSGYQFPLLIALLGRGREDIGRHIGLTYAWNTGGAIAGSLAGGFLLLPLFTAIGSWKGAVLLLALLGAAAVVTAFRSERRIFSRAIPATVIVCALLLLTAMGPTAVWRHSPIGAGRVDLTRMSRNEIKNWMAGERRTTRWEAEGREVSLGLSAENGLAFIINGKVDGNARFDAPTQVMLGVVGALLHPAPKTAMVIGLGTGSSAGWLADIETVRRVDVAELEPGILEVARRCVPVNRNVVGNSKVRTIIADAREVLLTVPEKYDLIVSEPSNPYRAGIASLYTLEFYRAVANRLAPGGIFSQWIQAYEVDTQTVRTIYATLCAVFPYIETWQTMSKDMLLVCSQKPHRYSVPQLRRRLATEPYRSALLAAWGAVDLEGFFSRFVGRPALARWVAQREMQESWLNTDDRMRVEYGFARAVGRGRAFALSDLVAAARRRGEHRPALTDGTLDWALVDDHRLMMNVLEGIPAPNDTAAARNGEQLKRQMAYNYFLAGDFEAVYDNWQAQSRKPMQALELAMMAEALADRGDSETFELLEKLKRLRPVEADVILARYHWRMHQPQQAVQALESALIRFRTDPWPNSIIIQRGLNLALQTTDRYPEQARPLYHLLMEPFAVGILNEVRKNLLLNLAARLGNEEVVRVIRQIEPHVPWQRNFLVQRAAVYKAVGDPMHRRAALDLQAFLDDEPVRIAAPAN